jgi:ABC-type multidrug transport system ATPase subunit
MSTVRSLADQARTILCTIHQPSPATYALFNTLLLLSAGRVLYFGPASEAVSFFQFGYNHISHYSFPYLAGSNPAEYVIAVASGAIAPVMNNNSKKSGEEMVVSSDIMADFYLTTEYAKLLESILNPAEFDEESNLVNDIGHHGDNNWETVAKKNHVNSVFAQVPVLMSRMFLVKRREYHQLTLSLAKLVLFFSPFFQYIVLFVYFLVCF